MSQPSEWPHEVPYGLLTPTSELYGLIPEDAPDEEMPTEASPCPYCGALPMFDAVFWAPGEVLEHDREFHPWLFERPASDG